MTRRTAHVERSTSETAVSVRLHLDGTGRSSVNTGIGFLDHMLSALALHARVDLELTCKGDLHVDDHHTAEDCALVLGDAIRQALGDKQGIRRFASAYAPLDEALARSVIDLSGRPFVHVNLSLKRDSIGTIACENISHFFTSLATAAMMTLHIDVLRSKNDHHAAEASFKAFALALRQAITIDEGRDGVPSTKGAL